MNTKVLLGFLAGVIATAGVGFYLSHRQVPHGQASQGQVSQGQVSQNQIETPAAGITVWSGAAASAMQASAQAAPRVSPLISASVVNDEPRPSATKAAVKKVSRLRPPEPIPAPQGISTQSTPRPAAAEPERTSAIAAAPVQEIAKVTPPVEEPPALPPAAPVEKSAVQTSPETPAPNTVTIPSGTLIPVRLGEALSTRRNKPGDAFTATLDQPIVADGFVIAERGARVEGRVVEAVEAGRVKGLAQLSVELTRINTADGQRIAVRTAAFIQKGAESKGEDAAKIGIGAVLGTIIGAAAGGGKGAAVGAAAGGAAGTGTVIATRGKPAELPVETRISFRLDQPVTITEQLRR